MMKQIKLPDELVNRIIEAIEAEETDEDKTELDVDCAIEREGLLETTDVVIIPRDEYDALMESNTVVNVLCAMIERGKGYMIDGMLEAFYDIGKPTEADAPEEVKEGE